MQSIISLARSKASLFPVLFLASMTLARGADAGGQLNQNSGKTSTGPVAASPSATSPVTPSPAPTPTPAYAPPASPRAVFNFNSGWKFLKQDVPGAEAPGFDDSKWDSVSTPHTYNDVDSYKTLIVHSSGDMHSIYMGPAWYRKTFRLPESAKEAKVFLVFDGLRQAGDFYINGKPVGIHEDGVSACGLDITPFVTFGNTDNVVAVRVDNSNDYKERATETSYEWNSSAFNPCYGGLNGNVRLHLTGKTYQTLPLYRNLETSGIYVHASNFNIAAGTCSLTVDSQVRNEGEQQVITLGVDVVDASGKKIASFEAEPSDMVQGQTDIITAQGNLAGVHWWDVRDPYLYDVYTTLTVDGKVVDVCRTQTGFRKAEFRGGVGKGGFYLNDRFVYLKGYAQRASDDWAGLGQAYPDWMHDFNAALIRESNANYLRWMHVAPHPADEAALDRYGIVNSCPAGDKEKDADGRQWDQRVELMRDTIIALRNHPSIFFWEAGNNGISADHMRQMVELRKTWDPDGGRVMGCRDIKDDAAAKSTEYFGIMIGQDDGKDKRKTPQDIFRSYSEERRDLAPYLETEDFREEAARRFWDDYSAPHFGFKPGPNDTYGLNSETFCVGTPGINGRYASDGAIKRYFDYYRNRISNTDPAHAKWAAYASIYWSDSNADGRQDSSEVCRVSGKVDSVRLPKQAFYAYKVMQAESPDIHIIGHWNYATGVTKTMYVVCNCDSVELFVNNQSKGKIDHPTDGYLFPFPSIAWEPGKISAVGYRNGKKVCETAIETAGAPKKIRLTPIIGPKGLQADGSDVALLDVEVLDAQGRRCPLDEDRIDFKVEGPCVWRGGVNSGIPGSINQLYLNTECGINRVSLRSTLTPGAIKVTATRNGLDPATVELTSLPVENTNGLIKEMPQSWPAPTPSKSLGMN
jgi:beta-galactosidase